MKILIVSDTHRQNGNLCQALLDEQPVDMLIHLGDVEGSEDYIHHIASCPVEIVAGNNDFFSRLPREKEIMLGPYRVLLTHGHYYQVSLSLNYLREEALQRGVDIVMFGHTHRPLLEQEKGLTLLNPGSISYPRQEGREPSYMGIEISENGEVCYTTRYLQGQRRR